MTMIRDLKKVHRLLFHDLFAKLQRSLRLAVLHDQCDACISGSREGKELGSNTLAYLLPQLQVDPPTALILPKLRLI